ncbi:MAG: glutathione-disulfide reductase [Myxococcales bacterium]|nr:glutathione-disulfide reductase [Myxococcales bacterium]
MSNFDFDFFVIGAGSGGVRAARIAAGHGARVAIAELDRYGGTCVNVGCVPKKLLVYASSYAQDFADAAGFGWSVAPPGFDWPTLVRNKDAEIQRLNGIYEQLLSRAGVAMLRGRAEFRDAHTLEVAGRSYTSRYILIATGGEAHIPAIAGAEYGITSSDAFYLPELPRRVVIIGGGYIALEFAGIFAGLGSEVHVIHRSEKVLRGFDADIRTHLTEALGEAGLDMRCGFTVQSIERADDGTRVVQVSDGTRIECDQLLLATGRVPRTAELGLERAGLDVCGPGGAVEVDDFGKSRVPHIFAVGDVTGGMALTPVAIAEGHAVADTLFGAGPRRADRRHVPTAVFSQPPVGTVGLSEEEARANFERVQVYRSVFRPMRTTLSGRGPRAMTKLVVDPTSDRVLGAHMVGPDAGEIIQGLAVALKAGVTKAQLDATVGVHPTTAEEFVLMGEPVA